MNSLSLLLHVDVMKVVVNCIELHGFECQHTYSYIQLVRARYVFQNSSFLHSGVDSS